jgi:phage baseplate assembly protein W
MAAKGLNKEELAAEQGEQLPAREAMSLINANIFTPINAALALNILSDNSTAVAVANQQIGDVTQTT